MNACVQTLPSGRLNKDFVFSWADPISYMLNPLLAEVIVLIHFGFILFVVFGGFLVLKRRKLIWLHLPAAIWGTLIELTGGFCPLTTLENRLRLASGESYADGFIEHYIIPIIYPSALTRPIQITFGFAVILLNFFIYRKLFKTWRSQNKKSL
jgi:hypothetical protein